MILGDGRHLAGSTATLDDLFRRAGVRHPDALALADPPNRKAVTDHAPRELSFAQTDRAISALAARLRGLGLQTDTVVAMQLPNTVESVIAFLGVLRAGMIAVPMPLLWRRHDMVAALRDVGAKAIITSSCIGSVVHTDIAVQAAVELFPIRYLCSFGRDLPDGIVPLDDVFDSRSTEVFMTPIRSGPAAAHVAAVTFGLDPRGLFPVARSHAELIAGGLAIFLEANIAANTSLLSTIPTGSFAGIVLTMLPWLLSGGALHLHHGFDPDPFATQCRSLKDGVAVLPEALLPPLATAALPRAEIRTIIALWRAPERLALARPPEGATPVVDVTSFGEIGGPHACLPARGGAWPGPPSRARRRRLCRHRLCLPDRARSTNAHHYSSAIRHDWHRRLPLPSARGGYLDWAGRSGRDRRDIARRRSRPAARWHYGKPRGLARGIAGARCQSADIRGISATRRTRSRLISACR